jgi:hypothetical protein
MAEKIEYPLLPNWYWYSKFPKPKWYRVKSKRLVKSGAAYKGADIGWLQPDDVVCLDMSEQDLGWGRAMEIKGVGAPHFVHPEIRNVLASTQPNEILREAWIELDLAQIVPYEEEPEPIPVPPEPEPVPPEPEPVPVPPDPEPVPVPPVPEPIWVFDILWFTIKVYRKETTKK